MKLKRTITDTFKPTINNYWNQLLTGGGLIKNNTSHLKIGFKSARAGTYTDAQLDDYTMFARSKYPWKAPLRMTVKAKFDFFDKRQNKSNTFQGTAGFGFWNNPFSVTGAYYALPEAIWFFYTSSKSCMAFSQNDDYGWKAQVVHSLKLSNILYFFPTAFAVLFARLTKNTRFASKWIKRFSGIEETSLEIAMDQWHEYKLEWKKNQAKFYVDDKMIMMTNNPPTRPLGFVLWVDNQYAVVTPTGKMQFATATSKALFLHIASVKIESC